MELDRIRKSVIIALFTNDELFETFVLKGGNALLVHGINARASIDIDVSMEQGFEEENLTQIQNSLEDALKKTFAREGHTVIDVNLKKQPRKMPENKELFWGGYRLEFKIVSLEDQDNFKDIEKLRRRAIPVEDALKDRSSAGKIFKVDISRYEFCKSKVEKNIDNFPIYVYTPLAIVYEKLRAICQQHEEYKDYVETNRKPRSRDFFDIYTVIERHSALSDIKEDLLEEENLKDLKEIFSLKKVPLSFLDKVKNYRDYHEEDFSTIKATVFENENLETYDFYFDYTVNLCKKITERLTDLRLI